MTRARIGQNGRIEMSHDDIELEARRLRAEAIRESFRVLRDGLRRGLARVGRHAHHTA